MKNHKVVSWFVIVLLIVSLLFGISSIRITRTVTNQLVRIDEDPLYYALKGGEPLATVESILISHGYDYDKLNKPVPWWERCYLDVAVEKGDPAIVELLIEYGANPDGINNGFHASPLISAIRKNDKEMVVLLLTLGASPTMLKQDTSAIEVAIYEDVSEDIKEILSRHSPYAKDIMNHFHVKKFGVPFCPCPKAVP